MAKEKKKRLGILSKVNFSQNFKSDYYDYGMSVIEDRAVPDVRDGLKPVQRAILIEMLTSHITSKAKTVKVAKITGAVIGKWHPHGDISVEDALAVMAAPWKNSMPAIEIKGNGGSVFGDSHAAGRYIEARLSPTGDAYGKNLKEGIVPYMPNFDETLTMPKVLPAQLPYLLINGGEGIAVGLASSIPPHNPVEVIRAFLRYAEDSSLSVKQLMITMHGPDFPTAGEIINKRDLDHIYETGLGSIRVRGKIRYDEKDRSLHIYEIPFNFAGSMNNLVDELAIDCLGAPTKSGKRAEPKIKGVLSVLDHSGKDGIDITIRLRRGVDPEQVKQAIFAKTRMETNFKFDFSALNNRHQKRYNLKSYFKEYLAFQNEIVANEYKIEAKSLSKRLEILTAMLGLKEVLNQVVECARLSSSKKELKQILMGQKVPDGLKTKKDTKIIEKFHCSELQAEAIASLPIYRLNRIDYDKMEQEFKEDQQKLAYAQKVQQDSNLRRSIIIKRHENELNNLKGKDFKRKTKITDDKNTTSVQLEVPESEIYFTFNKYHYLRLQDRKFENCLVTTNKKRIGFIDENGICYNLFLENAKMTSSAGVLIDTLVKAEAPIVGFTNHINDSEKDKAPYILYVFSDGHAKLTDARNFMTKSHASKVSRGKTKITIVKALDVPKDTQKIVLNGESFKVSDFSIQGISGVGKKMIKPIQDGLIKIEFK